MNDIFDFRRFGWYARKEFKENWKAYALSLIGVITILGYNIYQEWKFVHSIFYKSDYVVKTAWSFAIPMMIGIPIASSFVWKAFANKKHTFTALTLPVSVLERFIFAWLVAIPLTVAGCFVLWEISWSMATPLLLNDFPKLLIEPAFGGLANGGSSKADAAPYSLVLFLGGSALFMLGAVSLGRLNLLKTLGIVIIAGIAFYWLQTQHLRAIFPNAFEINAGVPFPFVPPQIFIQSSKNVYSTNFISVFEPVYRVWWIVCVPLLLYVCTFLKIKEKEI